MTKCSNIVLGFLGSSLDGGSTDARWNRWRPTVGLCQQKDFPVARLELLVDPRWNALAERVVNDIAEVSPKTKVVCHEMSFRDPWDFQEMYSKLYDFVSAYEFAVEKADYFVHLSTGTHVAQICWFLLTEANYAPARLVQTAPRGESDGKGSAAGRHTVIDLDLSKYDRLATRFAKEQEQTLDFLKSGMATKNKRFNQLVEQIEQVALRSKAPILITGPTGAGKSLLASRIYDLRKQRAGLTGRFVEVNCATLRGDQAMSALFGHKRGAFTGAQSDRAGLLKEADGGLVFLDEIGELGLDEQAMLLRALEEKTFLPLGSDKPGRSDFQLIVGTNQDLRASVAEKRFREDLLARINLWTFTLPGLADRREDIAVNVDFELKRFAKTHRREVRFNKEALDRFLKFARSPEAMWSANFRDLHAAVTRMATLAPKGRITEACVEAEIERLKAGWERPSATKEGSVLKDILDSKALAKIDPFDLAQLEYVVRDCRESKTLSDAGRRLFSVSRQKKAKPNDADRLKKYLARFALTWEQVTAGP